MTLTTADLAALFKKRLKIGLIISGVGLAVGLIGYFLPGSIQLVPLVVGYLGLYVGIIFILYSLWHRFMSSEAERADKADKAAAALLTPGADDPAPGA
jgi:hypothetical protein